MEQAFDNLARCTNLAFDTEADSFFRYREKVCLIQMSTRDTDYLFDPLARCNHDDREDPAPEIHPAGSAILVGCGSQRLNRREDRIVARLPAVPVLLQ